MMSENNMPIITAEQVEALPTGRRTRYITLASGMSHDARLQLEIHPNGRKCHVAHYSRCGHQMSLTIGHHPAVTPDMAVSVFEHVMRLLKEGKNPQCRKYGNTLEKHIHIWFEANIKLLLKEYGSNGVWKLWVLVTGIFDADYLNTRVENIRISRLAHKYVAVYGNLTATDSNMLLKAIRQIVKVVNKSLKADARLSFAEFERLVVTKLYAPEPGLAPFDLIEMHQLISNLSKIESDDPKSLAYLLHVTLCQPLSSILDMRASDFFALGHAFVWIYHTDNFGRKRVVRLPYMCKGHINKFLGLREISNTVELLFTENGKAIEPSEVYAFAESNVLPQIGMEETHPIKLYKRVCRTFCKSALAWGFPKEVGSHALDIKGAYKQSFARKYRHTEVFKTWVSAINLWEKQSKRHLSMKNRLKMSREKFDNELRRQEEETNRKIAQMNKNFANDAEQKLQQYLKNQG